METAPAPAERLQTLTLQDLIWINLVATKKVSAFDYEMLEQATFRQFGYGGRPDVLGQAAGMLQSVLRGRPFAEGNALTALIACGAFLRLNGIVLRATSAQAEALIAAMRNESAAAREALEPLTETDPDWKPVLEPDLRRIVAELAERYAASSPRR